MMLSIIVLIALFLFTVTVHEYAHGWVALRLGDRTAKEAGRLTLNPLRHIDPIWTVLLPVILILLRLPAIGMARPVPVNFANLNHPKRDMIWVAIAGPIANLLLAWMLSLAFHYSGWGFFLLGVYFNLGLAVFNLLPIPPMDGSRVLMGLLPIEWVRQYIKLERYGFLIIMALVWLGFVWTLLVPAVNFFCRLLGVPAIV